ncbi:ubiquitin-protein ligase, putative, partial [Entamoeba invadens IP1]
MSLSDDDIQKRMDLLTRSIATGCGNPFCTNKLCKSNPSHEPFSSDDNTGIIVEYAIGDYHMCQPYISANDVYKLTPDFFKNERNILQYLTPFSLATSFR